MAVRVYAAARHFMRQLTLTSFLLSCLPLSTMCAYVSLKYSHHELIGIGLTQISRVFDYHNIPSEMVRPLGSAWITIPAERRRRRRRNRRQKRSCRAGMRGRLAQDPHAPPLPSLFVTNVQSLPSKMEELELTLSMQRNIRDC